RECVVLHVAGLYPAPRAAGGDHEGSHAIHDAVDEAAVDYPGGGIGHGEHRPVDHPIVQLVDAVLVAHQAIESAEPGGDVAGELGTEHVEDPGQAQTTECVGDGDGLGGERRLVHADVSGDLLDDVGHRQDATHRGQHGEHDERDRHHRWRLVQVVLGMRVDP